MTQTPTNTVTPTQTLTPSPTPPVNYLIAVVINNPEDAGKQFQAPSFDFTSNQQPGSWYFTVGGDVLTVTQPSLFIPFLLPPGGSMTPVDGEQLTITQEIAGFPGYISFNPPIGDKFWYLISSVEYTSAQLSTILANATLIVNPQLVANIWRGSFTYDIIPTQSNYTYLIYDYRHPPSPIPCPNCVVQDITIGTQTWAKCNLDVSTYANNDPIPEVTDPTAWAALTTGAWCYYNNDSVSGATYGKLYNWYAVNDPRGLAPAGYHIPSDTEWTTLTTFLGGESVAGGKMKETGLCHWLTPNTNATNSSDFTGLPGGCRYLSNTSFVFIEINKYGYWWSSTVNGPNTGYPNVFYRRLSYNNATSGRNNISKSSGFSVRCIKN
jgi:uncharacterized protein (TIGR02145 family)